MLYILYIVFSSYSNILVKLASMLFAYPVFYVHVTFVIKIDSNIKNDNQLSTAILAK